MQEISSILPEINHRTVIDMKIMSVVLQATGAYDNQVYRPLTLNVTNDSLQNLSNSLDRGNGRLIENDVAQFAAQTLRPSTNPLGLVDIPNGWGTKRYSFEIVVMVTTSLGQNEERIMGWSECHDVSHGGYVDPEMRFHVNSVTKRKVVSRITPSGSFQQLSPGNSMQVFFESEFNTIGENANTPKLIRPTDLYGRMVVSDLDPGGMWDKVFGSGMSGPGVIMDSRSNVSGLPLTSSRSNTLSPSYLTRTLNAHLSAEAAHGFGVSDSSFNDTHAIRARARESEGIREIPLNTSDFLKAMSDARRYNPVLTPMFTLNELFTLDPSLRSDTSGRFIQNDMPLTGQVYGGSSLAQTTESAIAAYYLAQAMPALLAKVGAMGVSVVMQNADHFAPRVMITGHTQLLPALHQVLTSMIETEIMPILTASEERFIHTTYELTSLYHDSKIQVSVNGEPLEHFTIPQFADSRFSSMITNESGAANMTQVLGATLSRIGLPISTDFSAHTPLDISNMIHQNNAIAHESQAMSQMQQQPIIGGNQSSNQMNLNTGIPMPMVGVNRLA